MVLEDVGEEVSLGEWVRFVQGETKKKDHSRTGRSFYHKLLFPDLKIPSLMNSNKKSKRPSVLRLFETPYDLPFFYLMISLLIQYSISWLLIFS